MCAVYESKPILKEGGGCLTGFHRELTSHGISFPHASRKLSIQEILSRSACHQITANLGHGLSWKSQFYVLKLSAENNKGLNIKLKSQNAQGAVPAGPQLWARGNLSFLSWLLYSTLEVLLNVAIPLKYWFTVVRQTIDRDMQENIFQDVNKREPMRWLSYRAANTCPPVVLKSTTNCQMQN